MNEIYNESIDLFYKTFDVPKLCFEILSMVKTDAVCGKLYNAEVVSAKSELFKVRIEFRTEENTYFTVALSFENADEFCYNLGCNKENVESVIGNKYKVFYANIFDTIVLGRIE